MPRSVGVSSHRFEITKTWDGESLQEDEWARIELLLGDEIELRVEAAYYGDPAPAPPPGRCDGLWNFEVVELFLLGDDQHYLEIELGPHGHWLGLSLSGPRVRDDDSVAIGFEVDRQRDRWSGRALIDRDWGPSGLDRANAYAIHGAGATRRYLAMTPVPGDGPDFHRLEHFKRFRR
jgi:hypothetical protein